MDKRCVKKVWIADNGDGTYTNPILYTDYSDPDVIRVGEDFFMVASSFCNTPAVPVLHSKDLVNWKVISYAMEKLPGADYDSPMHGRGAWAPAIRYHEDTYYILIPMSDEGIFMVKSKDPFAGWEKPVCVRKGAGWIDPCPFWDDDGKAYMVSAFAKSRIGFNSVLNLAPMKVDATALLDDGKYVFDGTATQPTIEGPKLYKRNGYYYIFAPAGGVPTGWQTVLRSKNIWGPYEEKKVLHQGSTSVNGPHQGAWVDTPDGQDWFLHFQDAGNAGRIVHLQPMYWENDWPVMGRNIDENGCGEPVERYRKPVLCEDALSGGGHFEPDSPEESDFFESTGLGLQWQWNANYKKQWYHLDGKSLTLYAQPVESGTRLCNVSNLLLQKWPAPEFQITTSLDLSGMEEGDVCGLVSLGGKYADLAVAMRGGRKVLVQHSGPWKVENKEERTEDAQDGNRVKYVDREVICGEIDRNQIYLRMRVENERLVSFEYSYDELQWEKAGSITEAAPGRWVGVKVGLYAIHEGEGTCGLLRADYFVFESL